MTSGKQAVMGGVIVLVLSALCRANSDTSALGNSPRPPDSQRAFLDAQTLHDRWAANYTHIRSVKFRVTERILSASGPGTERMVPVSHWAAIRDGARFYGRHVPGAEDFTQGGPIVAESFDGSIAKIYRLWRNEGEIHQGSAGQAMRSYNPIEVCMLAARTKLEMARRMRRDQRVINKLVEEFPEGCPELTVTFRIAQEEGWLRVLPQLEEVAGKMCHVLEMSGSERSPRRQCWCWLAHDCGMLPLRYVEKVSDNYARILQVQEVGRIETEAGTVWYPVVAAWDVMNPSGRTFKQELRVSEYVPHIKVPPDTCDIQFPPGTKVIDTVANVVYTQGVAPAVAAPKPKNTSSAVLPTGSSPAPIEFKHFPDRLHAFVWRNWEMVSLERMAEVLGTTTERVRQLGESMGLPPHRTPPAEYQQRGYITIIRRNWHLLPYEQLLQLLGWDAEKLAFTLREDDFLWVKLGNLKPACPTLRYAEPNEAVIKRCEQIKALVSSHFVDEFSKPAVPRFDFVRDLSGMGGSLKAEGLGDGGTVNARRHPQASLEAATQTGSRREKIRFLYSYCGVFGDPLLTPELDPYPDGLLQRLSDLGVNGVWLHVVLRQLAPGSVFPEFGAGHERRIESLRRLVERAKKYGIDIYLYMNEPRAMEASFFKNHEDIRGVQEGNFYTLCTSAPEVRQWLTDSLTYVFKEVPGLGGVFTITASENLSNCYSHSRTAAGCPRCAKRPGPEVIAEVNKAIAAGVWAGNPNAKVIVWDWGWPDASDTKQSNAGWTEQIINALPDNVYLMSVSEWSTPIVRGGVATTVGEYSMSTVGPGPRATKHWALAKKRGLKTLAKIQANCTWEISAVPYLPVMNLVAQHCANLADAYIDGLMLSWSVGGYPSPNLQLVRCFDAEPRPTVEQALAKVAEARYGADAAPYMLKAWSQFSDAFKEYPFHGSLVYMGPMQCAPANLLYPEPTKYRATMVGFPYDDLDGWRAVYPAQVLEQQFGTIANGWAEGERMLVSARHYTRTFSQEANVREDVTIAGAVRLHFASAANQVRFIMARNALLSGSLKENECQARIEEVRQATNDEIRTAKSLYWLVCRDSRIGFEASNHYYYLPLDLVEKVVNCDYVLNTWLPRLSASERPTRR